jgi:hypothetical protein
MEIDIIETSTQRKVASYTIKSAPDVHLVATITIPARNWKNRMLQPVNILARHSKET